MDTAMDMALLLPLEDFEMKLFRESPDGREWPVYPDFRSAVGRDGLAREMTPVSRQTGGLDSGAREGSTAEAPGSETPSAAAGVEE